MYLVTFDLCSCADQSKMNANEQMNVRETSRGHENIAKKTSKRTNKHQTRTQKTKRNYLKNIARGEFHGINQKNGAQNMQRLHVSI